jgi:hypothetical protein
LVSVFVLLFNPDDGGDILPKRPLTFDGLYGVVSNKMELFVTTAVATSDPTEMPL